MCEKITGTLLSASMPAEVSAEQWAVSMTMPSLFISRTTSRPKAVRPLCLRALGLNIADLIDAVMHQLQNAHAAVVKKFDSRQIAFQRIAAFDGQDGAGYAAFFGFDDFRRRAGERELSLFDGFKNFVELFRASAQQFTGSLVCGIRSAGRPRRV